MLFPRSSVTGEQLISTGRLAPSARRHRRRLPLAWPATVVDRSSSPSQPSTSSGSARSATDMVTSASGGCAVSVDIAVLTRRRRPRPGGSRSTRAIASPEASKARRRITSSLWSSTAAFSPPAKGCRGGVTHREQPPTCVNATTRRWPAAAGRRPVKWAAGARRRGFHAVLTHAVDSGPSRVRSLTRRPHPHSPPGLAGSQDEDSATPTEFVTGAPERSGAWSERGGRAAGHAVVGRGLGRVPDRDRRGGWPGRRPRPGHGARRRARRGRGRVCRPRPVVRRGPAHHRAHGGCPAGAGGSRSGPRRRGPGAVRHRRAPGRAPSRHPSHTCRCTPPSPWWCSWSSPHGGPDPSQRAPGPSAGW